VLPVAIILLAAGDSSRLGRPKQLLSYGSGTLLRHAAEVALAAALGPVIVVLGAVEESCRETLLGLPVTIVSNPVWREGMGGSIAAGMQAVDETSYRAVIIMLCDQPAVTSEVLLSLDGRHRTTGKSLIASQYKDTLGPPALFAARHFPQLRRLHGAQGAKSLFQNHPDPGCITFPDAAWDIDTEDDLARVAELS
jgi:molybdenum cofactor cytidylyltransferase